MRVLFCTQRQFWVSIGGLFFAGFRLPTRAVLASSRVRISLAPLGRGVLVGGRVGVKVALGRGVLLGGMGVGVAPAKGVCVGAGVSLGPAVTVGCSVGVGLAGAAG